MKLPRVIIRLTLLLLTLSTAQAIELTADSFTLTFSAEGRPTSCKRKADGAELLAKGGGGEGFYLKGVRGQGPNERLPNVSLAPDGRLVAASADGKKKITVRVTPGPRELALRIEGVEGIDPALCQALQFGARGGEQLRVLALDYMTVAENWRENTIVKWNEFWHRAPQNRPSP